MFVGGAVIQWLRDELGLIASAAESEKAALSVPDVDRGFTLFPPLLGLARPTGICTPAAQFAGLRAAAAKTT